MKEKDLLNLIRISKSKSCIALLKKGLNVEEILQYFLEMQKKGKRVCLISTEMAEGILQNASKNNINIISIFNPLYPLECKEIHNAPIILYAKGNLELLTKVKFGIIGARVASLESLLTAEKFAKELSECGFCIVSGFAHGVDTYACKGAMKYGTIQILGSGVNVVYPRQNTKLYEEVLECGGLFLSELPPNAPAEAENFPLRNRIISSISKGILLVQASKKNKSSGSLITAKICLEQEKDLFAIPGHPLDDKFSGGNDLIKNGNAIFTTTSQDIMDMIGYHLKNQNIVIAKKNIERAEPDSLIKKTIKNYLSTNPISIDELHFLTKINIQELQFAIMEMEIADEVRKHYDGKFSISLL